MSSEDKIIRTLVDKVTGLPLTGKSVEARPTLGGASVPMPEIGGKGIYASANEVAHGEYKIYVNNTDSQDTHTIGPSRFAGVAGKVGWFDRAMKSKVFLSSYMTETDAAPTQAMFLNACNDAAGNSCELVLDFDFTLTAYTQVTGNLFIDLNGHTLSCANYLMDVVGMSSVRNGRLSLASSGYSYISSLGTTYIAVQIIGSDSQQACQCDGRLNDVYVGCIGIVATSGAIGFTGPSFIGAGFGTASKLRLTDAPDAMGSADGSGRLTDLQAFINDDMAKSVANNAYLTTPTKTQLSRWVNLPELTKTLIEGYGNTNRGIVSVSKLRINSSSVEPNSHQLAGIQYGLYDIFDSSTGRYLGISGVMPGTIYWDAYVSSFAKMSTVESGTGASSLTDVMDLVATFQHNDCLKMYTVSGSGVATRLLPTTPPMVDNVMMASGTIAFSVGNKSAPFTNGLAIVMEFSITPYDFDMPVPAQL